MRRILLFLIIALILTPCVSAMEFQPPAAPDCVADLIPKEADSFSQGLWNIIKAALSAADDSFHDVMSICLTAGIVVILSGVLRILSEHSGRRSIDLCCVIIIAELFFSASTALIHLGMDTTQELREYGKLLLPVMTAAMAARGGVSASTALYAGTAFFDHLLSSLLSSVLSPLIYLFLALSIGNSVLNEGLLKKMKDFLKWIMGWILKAVLSLFTGYLTITGAVSGTADAAAVRTAKVLISSAVPVVGSILSDASETVLVSAATLGNAAGVYGMITVLALFSGPFAKIGLHYVFLKLSGAFCSVFDSGPGVKLMEDFAAAMGLILAMISTQTVLVLISTMCLMKGAV